MSNSRTRMVAVAGSLALSLSLVAAPAVMAQDGPDVTIENLMAAIEAKDFEALPSFFCEAQAAQAAQFDISAMAGEMPEGMDVESLFDAFIFDVELESVDVVSETETEAVVHVLGSMSMDINIEALVPFIEAIIEMSGMEATPETVEMFTGMMMSEFEAETEQIDEDITLVPGEAMAWLVCSELGVGDDAMAEESAEPMAEEDAEPMAEESPAS